MVCGGDGESCVCGVGRRQVGELFHGRSVRWEKFNGYSYA